MDDVTFDAGRHRIVLQRTVRKRMRKSSDRGWIVLGPAAPGKYRPTVAYGVLTESGAVVVRGGLLLPSVRHKIVDAAISYGLITTRGDEQ